MGTMRRLLFVLVFVLLPHVLMAQPVGPDAAVRDALAWGPDYRHAADVLSTALVGTAVALPCVLDRSWSCAKREALNVGLAYGFAELTKRLVHRTRPNGIDEKSFYSMHTSIACAAVLSAKHRRELWSLCPAVGYTRIAADWHFFSDTAAGAGEAAGVAALLMTVRF